MDWVTSGMIGFGVIAGLLLIVWVVIPKGWRTLTFNILSGVAVALAPVLDHLANVPWHELVDRKTAFFIVQGLIFANVILRVVTTGRVGQAR